MQAAGLKPAADSEKLPQRLSVLPQRLRALLAVSSQFQLCCVLFLCLLTACTSATETASDIAPIPPSALQIEAPAQINAGEPLQLIVYTTPPDTTTPILLTAQGTFGFYPQKETPAVGHAHFTIPPLQTRHAGVVHLQASVGQIGSSATVEILPGTAVDPVLPLVGPRSIVADGDHWTMAITTPRDALDNPVADGSVVTLRAQHPVAMGAAPESGLELIETKTRNLVSWARIYSRTRAGRLLLTATADDGHSPERVVLEVPGPPILFALQADPLTAAADGHQWIRIRSEQITDRFGNVLLDGNEVTILAAMPPDEMRTVPAITVDGRIYTTLQAPTRPGTMFVRAWIGGASSQAVMVTFTPGPAVQTITLSSVWQTDGILLRAGPLVGDREQFVPDGTEVTFTIMGPNGRSPDGTMPDGAARQTVVPSEYGYATLLVRTLTLLPGPYAVAVDAGTGVGNSIFTVPETIALPPVTEKSAGQ